VLGDSVYSNMIVLGAAWQRSLVPLTHAAIAEAIKMNGAAVAANLRAFDVGRWAVAHPAAMAEFLSAAAPAPLMAPDLTGRIAQRAAHLLAYQDQRLADRYLALVNAIADPALREAVALGYHKVLAYKDEYEVARLLVNAEVKATAAFDGDFRMAFHLAPPFLSGKTAMGRPKKREFGQAWLPAFRLLARLKGLRGTWFDPFGRTAERRLERSLIAQYEADVAMVLSGVTAVNHATALALARLPLDIRGFGPVKEANYEKAMLERVRLLKAFSASPNAPVALAAR
jgi:indolepyruvate ferredoxin oxidoreductase